MPLTRRLTAALTTATLAGSSLALAGVTSGGAAQAADSTPGYSLQHITVTVKVGPNNDQSCLVDADIYKPDRASRSRKKPAILTTNGFGGSKDDSNESAIGRGFVKQGYVVLAYTGLGFPNSGCKITLDDPDYDGKAGKQMVSRAGRHQVLPGRQRRLAADPLRRPGAPRRPPRRHDRRVLRRSDPVRRRDAGQARRRPDPDHHLERPLLLARAEQHRPRPRRHLPHAGRRQEAVGRPVLLGRHHRRRPGLVGRPLAQLPALPELRRRRLPRGGAAQHPRLPRPGHPRPRPARVGLDVHEEGHRPDPRRAGPEGHPVQPAGGRRHLPRAAGPGHAHPDDLAVVGTLRQRPGSRRARLRRRVAAVLLPRQPLPELDEPLRQGPAHGPGRRAVLLLPRLRALRHPARLCRSCHLQGVRRAELVLRQRRPRRSTSPAPTA